jgi:anti-anti-sigma regulatory factor
LIRITQVRDGSRQHLFVEGTLSDGWVEALETSWIEARSQSNGEPLRIDLSGVTYVDDSGRELLARMIQGGAELHATGIMTKAVVEEITEMLARDCVIQAEATNLPAGQAVGGGDKINAAKLRMD